MFASPCAQSVVLVTCDLTVSFVEDMKAPQKIVNPQQWPHIFAPGEPKLYVDLSLAEFCAGHLVTITQLADKPL